MTTGRTEPRLAFTGAWGAPPLRPELVPDEIHLWRIPLDATDDRHMAVLSAAERARADGFLRRQDARQFALTRAAVRGILGRYLSLAPEAVRFAMSRSGKPSVAGPDPSATPRYNSSHSHRMALCAVAGVDVGVDLEWIREAPIAAGIAAGIVSPNGPIRPDELPSAERDQSFFQAWTRTEAALKATGEGLSAIDRRPPAIIRALAGLEPWRYDTRLRISDVPIALDYAGAVAMINADAVKIARCWTWE